MSNEEKKHSKRSSAAARFDEITLAAFTVFLVVTVAAVLMFGMATAEERIGCGLNDIVNVVMAYQRPCQ